MSTSDVDRNPQETDVNNGEMILHVHVPTNDSSFTDRSSQIFLLYSDHNNQHAQTCASFAQLLSCYFDVNLSPDVHNGDYNRIEKQTTAVMTAADIIIVVASPEDNITSQSWNCAIDNLHMYQEKTSVVTFGYWSSTLPILCQAWPNCRSFHLFVRITAHSETHKTELKENLKPFFEHVCHNAIDLTSSDKSRKLYETFVNNVREMDNSLTRFNI